MGNSLHIVYFIEMKNMRGKCHGKQHNKSCSYRKLFRKTNVNTYCENSSMTDTRICDTGITDTSITDTGITDTQQKCDYINNEENLKKWLEYVECW